MCPHFTDEETNLKSLGNLPKVTQFVNFRIQIVLTLIPLL